MKKIRVGIVFGGRSGEHEVSIISAQSVMKAIDKNKYEVVPIFIDKKGSWQLGWEPKKLTGKSFNDVYLPPIPNISGLVDVKNREISEKIDVVFPVLHGAYGEDGTLQGLLELADIPYVGSRVDSSAVGMDKDLMKKIFKSVGLPITKHLVFLRNDIASNIQGVIDGINRNLKYPIFKKPANLGSSVGVSKTHNEKELKIGLKMATIFDRKVIVEEGIEKIREIEMAVLGNEDPKTSVYGEVVPSNEFYDYEDKFILDKAKLIIPADISKEVSDKIRSMAIDSFKSIDVAGMGRVDFL